MPNPITDILACTRDGIFVWPGVAIVARRGNSFCRATDQEVCNRAALLYGPDIMGGPLIPTLDRAARYLESGQIDQARQCLAKMKLPPLTSMGHRALADFARIAPNVFDPEKHDRWPAGSQDSAGGRFRSADNGESDMSGPTLVSDRVADRRLSFDDVKKMVKVNNRSGQSDELILSIIYKESTLDPGASTNGSTASGLMGMTKTAVREVLRKTGDIRSADDIDLSDPVTNIQFGSTYLKLMVESTHGNVARALRLYRGEGEPAYASECLAAEEALKQNPDDPVAVIAPIVHPPKKKP